MGRLWSTQRNGDRSAWLGSRGALPIEAKSCASDLPCASREFDTPMPEPLGDQLKGLFNNVADGPMPRRLLDLADALEDAFQRGELHRKVR